MKPRAMKNAITTSQAMGELKPLKASLSDRVWVRTSTKIAKKVTAPSGMTEETMPRIVITKTTNRCHARGSSPAGAGRKNRAAPIMTKSRRRARFTSFLGFMII